MKTREEIEAMSDEERTTATAELCNWVRDGDGWRGPSGLFYHQLPVNYLLSRDYMSMAEDVLAQIDIPDVRLKYSYAIQEVLGLGNMATRFDYIMATARQRNTAFLMVML